MKSPEINESNPLSDIIPDEIFKKLNSEKLLNFTSVRDHLIRKKYKFYRKNKLSVSQAILKLREDYPYLQFDTIRKIVYKIKR